MVQVTASVGHGLRNPLGVSNNAIYILKRKCTILTDRLDDAANDGLKEKVEHYLQMSTREVSAANRIISDLLATSKTKAPVLQWVNLDDAFSKIVEQELLPGNVNWDYQATPSPFMLRVDPLQLNQVLKNLMFNAVQAIINAGNIDGRVRLSAQEIDGQYQLRISDNGPGIVEAERAQIFEALFTTKAKGNGLGLWISREIIRAHGGELLLMPVNTETNGAAFELTLPRGQREELCVLVSRSGGGSIK